ncbi:MAG: U32 family peptidase [Epsilonproteobacteria bacterium]|nr:U32 family peptidase [Campylobacterota bacterium]
MPNIVELLSPAGNLQKTKIAVKYGADAVYGGFSSLSLRNRSVKEFDENSFKEAVNFVHSHGKKVYFTLNGFPYNSQIKLVQKSIEKAVEIGVDAFIVSTPGVIKLSKKIAPDMPLHLSTQANVMNYLDAEVYYDLGVKRVIAAREISLKDLEEIKKRLPKLELEIFVHGSMCFAYSGRCLISSLQSGRVPNRGSCANDCRFPYTLYAKNEENGTLLKLEEDENGTHIMNAKDLNLSSYVDEILKSGVIDSLKIEGRTKSPYYTAIVTKTYKTAIEDFYNGDFDAKKYEKELLSTKHRGFNDGYLVKRPYEKDGTQNIKESISEGTHQVYALVDENGEYFFARDKVELQTAYEIVLPFGGDLQECDNDIGTIYRKEGRYFIVFKKMVAKNNKTYEAIHSGNTNGIKLPCRLPGFSFFRKEIKG